MVETVQWILLSLLGLSVVVCSIKLPVLVYNIGWLIRYGAEYRARLDQFRGRQGNSPSGLREANSVLAQFGASSRLFGLGINEVGWRLWLERARWNPTLFAPWKRKVGVAALGAFDFVTSALVGGLSIILMVEFLPTSGPHGVVFLWLGGMFVCLSLVIVTVLNFEALVYLAGVGRYANSFLRVGDYLNNLERNPFWNEIAIIFGNFLATMFLDTIALVYLGAVGVPLPSELLGPGIASFSEAAYVSVMTFLFSSPLLESSLWFLKAFVIAVSLQGALILLLALAVLLGSHRVGKT